MKFNFLFTERKYVKVESKNNNVSFKSVSIDLERKISLSSLISENKPTTIFLSDDYGYCSTLLNYHNLLSSLNLRPNLVYKVNVSGTKMTIYPQVKTKKEFVDFENLVISTGDLD